MGRTQRVSTWPLQMARPIAIAMSNRGYQSTGQHLTGPAIVLMTGSGKRETSTGYAIAETERLEMCR